MGLSFGGGGNGGKEGRGMEWRSYRVLGGGRDRLEGIGWFFVLVVGRDGR